MKKDIVDLIKAQGNQACVMMPDIMSIPAIDLGEVTINESIDRIDLSEGQKQQFMDFLDKYEDSSRFWLLCELAGAGVHIKLLMSLGLKNEATPGFSASLYASNSINAVLNEPILIQIYVVSYIKDEEYGKRVFFGVKNLK